jgi:lysophospholipase L1-like esterase
MTMWTQERWLGLRLTAIVFAGLVWLAGSGTAIVAQRNGDAEHWVGTWATAPVGRASTPPTAAADAGRGTQRAGPAPLNFQNQTLRQIVHTTVGGSRARVVFSNAFGSEPLAIGAAHVALRDKQAAIVTSTDRQLTFAGSQSATIPPGAALFSDPVNLSMPPLADFAVDLYLPGDTAGSSSPITFHNGARQTSYVSPEGNHVGAAEMPVQTTTTSWFFITRVEVAAPVATGAIALFGDSITDGFNSTPDTNNRWPDHLAQRFRGGSGRVARGVLNLGIDGNQVLHDGAGVSALARFDRDVLVQSGVTQVVVLEGINDLGMRRNPRPAVEDLTFGHMQLIARAHARGLTIFGATLLPYEGTIFPGYYSAEGDEVRQKFNEWLRTSHAYDGVIDFDVVMRDPSHPARMLPQYDSGDHLHPNDAGYAMMARSVNLALLNGQERASGKR